MFKELDNYRFHLVTNNRANRSVYTQWLRIGNMNIVCLLLLLLGADFGAPQNAENFDSLTTSIAGLEQLIETETYLIKNLESYAKELEEKLLVIRRWSVVVSLLLQIMLFRVISPMFLKIISYKSFDFCILTNLFRGLGNLVLTN